MAQRDDEKSATPDDVKERFRAALEQKKEAAHRSAEAVANTGTVHGPEASGGQRKTFRRRSGSS